MIKIENALFLLYLHTKRDIYKKYINMRAVVVDNDLEVL